MTDTNDTDDGSDTDDDAQTPAGPRDPLANDFTLADVAIDLSRGRAVQVVGLPGQTVAEWSDREGYDLMDNYANERTRAHPDDPVIEAAYVSSIQSEPNGPRGSDEGAYTFPSSRLARVTIESIEGVDRPYDAVARDVLRRLLLETARLDDGQGARDLVCGLAEAAGADPDVVSEARELADVERRFDGERAQE